MNTTQSGTNDDNKLQKSKTQKFEVKPLTLTTKQSQQITNSQQNMNQQKKTATQASTQQKLSARTQTISQKVSGVPSRIRQSTNLSNDLNRSLGGNQSVLESSLENREQLSPGKKRESKFSEALNFSQSVLTPDISNTTLDQSLPESPTPVYTSFLKAPTIVKETSGNVKVFCRFRPLNERELETTGENLCVQFKDQKTCAVMGINKITGNTEPIDYTFDATFDSGSTQKQVYDTAVQPIVDQVLDGYNGTILAYGQTSSGKTHTMLGEDIEDEEERGIIPRMVKGIFTKIQSQPEDIEFVMKVSFVEIYNEKIKDLLDPKKNNLKIHENKQQGVYVKDMTECYVGCEDEVYAILKIGNENRSIGATNMNKQSSRSHSCFIMQVEQKNLTDFSSRTGKIYLVDLAGSERISKTGAEGETLTEAQNINKSLTALGQVINALTDGKSQHVPYRDSKLTRILQESLGGNSKTSLIITCSPSIFNESETVSTLRFGQRAKQIKNKAKVNKEFSISELKYMLQMAEKEIKIKDLKIKSLEEALTLFQISGKVDTIEIEKFKQKLEEQTQELEKKLQQNIEIVDNQIQEQNVQENDEIQESSLSSSEDIPEDIPENNQQIEVTIEPQDRNNQQIEQDPITQRNHIQQPVIQTDPGFDEQELIEEELQDIKGEFIIFKDPTVDESKQQINTDSKQTEQASNINNLLEQNFKRLNYINKINILLKALMIERNRNSESEIKMEVLKREYTVKVKLLQQMQADTEHAIELVAQSEITSEKRNDEIQYLYQKRMADRFKIDQLIEKLKSMELILQKQEENKAIDPVDMEQRIDRRVKKVIEQEQKLLKEQKKIILEKHATLEKKIIDLKEKLQEANSTIQRYKQASIEERGESLQTTMNKLINSEKNLDQLKLMYHSLATSKETMKRDYAVLEKKYKRKEQKLQKLEEELQATRNQVADFKTRFKTLQIWIEKKGGVEAINKFASVKEEQFDFKETQDYDTQSVSIGQSKVSIRGGAPSVKGQQIPTIRGGGQKSNTQLQ